MWKIFFLITFLIIPPAVADNTSDFSLKTGLATGSVSRPASSTVESLTAPMGGTALTAAYIVDLSEDFTSQLQYGIFIDFPNNLLSRQGPEIAVLYHVFGGPRHLYQESSAGIASATYSSGLSLLSKMGAFDYSLSSKEDPSVRVVGRTLEWSLGVQYRYSWSRDYDIGVEVASTVMSFSASPELISTQLIEFSGFVRF